MTQQKEPRFYFPNTGHQSALKECNCLLPEGADIKALPPDLELPSAEELMKVVDGKPYCPVCSMEMVVS